MLFVTMTSLLSWAIPRRSGHKWSLAALVIVTLVTSFAVIDNVKHAGVIREDIRIEGDIVYSIVDYNSMAVFPFVLQKQHNWSAGEYVYLVRLWNHEGLVVDRIGPAPDQSEFMHLTLFTTSIAICFQGFLVAMMIILAGELIWIWFRRPELYQESPK